MVLAALSADRIAASSNRLREHRGSDGLADAAAIRVLDVSAHDQRGMAANETRGPG